MLTRTFQQSRFIEVRRTDGSDYGSRGRGVFATEKILDGTVIEEAPVIRMPKWEIYREDSRQNPTFSSYCFRWHRDPMTGEEYTALALGYGSLYNHSANPNAMYVYKNEDCLSFFTIRDVEEDEEITVNYNGSPDNKREIGFPKYSIPQ